MSNLMFIFHYLLFFFIIIIKYYPLHRGINVDTSIGIVILVILHNNKIFTQPRM